MNSNLEFTITSYYEADENLDDDFTENESNKFKYYQDKYVLRLFGRTQDGRSVCARLDDFTPYFYVKIFSRWSNRDIDKFVHILKDLNKKYARSLVDYEVVVKSDLHFGFCGGKKFKFIKLVFNSIVALKSVAKYISNNKIKLSGIEANEVQLETYEVKIDPFIRVIHLKNLDAAGWIVLPAGKYEPNLIDRTTTDLNFRIHWNDVERLKEIRPLAPIKILSYDIEAISCDSGFPQASRITDKIISICATCTIYGSETIVKSVAIGLGSSSQVRNATEQYMYETEEEVLLAWKDYIIREDPDIITGYNIKFFDNKYLYDRASHPKINCLRNFSQLSRLQGHKCEFTRKELSSSGLGDNILYQFDIIGRNEIDLMKIIQQDHKLTSYKLDKVSEHFMKQSIKNITFVSYDEIKKLYIYRLKTNITKLQVGNFVKIEEDDLVDEEKIDIKAIYPETSEIELHLDIEYFVNADPSRFNVCLVKDDMPIHEMFSSYPKGPDERARIHQYCIQDCALVSKLLHQLDIVTQRFAMASVSYVSVNYILMRGQGIKTLSLFAYTCSQEGYLIKDLKPPPQDDKNKVGYEGATVFEPKKGFYTRPIVVLDFNSLYPNSEREYDMSIENLVRDPRYENLEDYYYREIIYSIKENGVEVGKERCVFATHKSNLDANGKQKKYGILGTILTRLLTERKIAKQNKKNATSPEMKQVFEGQQNALKVSANSVYGNLGASVSPIFCKPIAAATTAVGRMRLEQAKDFVEKELCGILLRLYNAWKANNEEEANKILDAELEDRNDNKFINNILKPTVIELFDNYMIYPEVIYGDTDSNFYDFRITNNVTKEMPTDRWCRKICICLGLITSKILKIHLPNPQNMEFEKVCHPLSMMEKKKYIYNKYSDNPDKCDERVVMGYTLKRRDNAIIVHRVIGKAVEIAMDEQDTDKAIQYITQSLQDILDGKYPINDFITTKALRAHYKGKKLTTDDKGNAEEEGEWFWDDVKCSVAHVRLCQRMKKRDPGNCPQINDRIPFVSVAYPNSKKMLQAEKIEHPDYIIANNLKIDYLFYITNQIKNPCLQFFELITDKMVEVFDKIIKKETENNEKLFDNQARIETIKKFAKYGIVVSSETESSNKIDDDWDPSCDFKKSNIEIDQILATHSINKRTSIRARKQARESKKKATENMEIIKRKNKVIDLLVAEMNEKLENITSINLDDILSKMN